MTVKRLIILLYPDGGNLSYEVGKGDITSIIHSISRFDSTLYYKIYKGEKHYSSVFKFVEVIYD